MSLFLFLIEQDDDDDNNSIRCISCLVPTNELDFECAGFPSFL